MKCKTSWGVFTFTSAATQLRQVSQSHPPIMEFHSSKAWFYYSLPNLIHKNFGAQVRFCHRCFCANFFSKVLKMTSSSVFALIAFKKLVKCEKWGKCLQGVPTSLRFCENLTFFCEIRKFENFVKLKWNLRCVLRM